MPEKTNMLLKGFLKNLLVTSPAILGFGIILFSKGRLSDMILSFSLFLAGFTGVIVAIRQEIPMSIGSIRGKWAVFQGVGFAILLWGSALYILFR
jgi:hypothetical protein